MGIGQRIMSAGMSGALNVAKKIGEVRQLASGTPPPLPTGADIVGQRIQKPGVPRSMFIDPMLLFGSGGGDYVDNHITANEFFAQMRQAVKAMPILSLIIKTRCEQVLMFCRPARTRYDLGFKISMSEPSEKPNDEDVENMRLLTKMVQHCGTPDEEAELRPTFPSYMYRLTRDTLMYAQDATEIIYNNGGLPCAWYAVDASTIRYASRTSPVYSKDLADEIRYVQVLHGKVETSYRYSDLMLGIRNPTTDINNAGYPVSELEMGIRAISAALNAWDWNAKMFKQGTNAKGILNIPEASAPTIKEFMSMWRQAISGVDNVHRMPVTAYDKLEWIDMGVSQKDIEWQNYFDMLVKILTGLFSIDPEDINFKYGNTGQDSALNDGSNNKRRLREGSERGLKPLLQHFESQINHRLIRPWTDRYKFEFVGLDAESREEALKFNTERVKTSHTIDEIRALDDLPPLPNGEGAIILDSVFLQNRTGMQQQQMGMDGGGGMGDDDQMLDEDTPVDEYEADDEGDGYDDADAGGDDDVTAKSLRPTETGWWL